MVLLRKHFAIRKDGFSENKHSPTIHIFHSPSTELALGIGQQGIREGWDEVEVKVDKAEKGLPWVETDYCVGLLQMMIA